MKQQAYERSRYFAGVFQLHALGTLANTGLIPKNGGADCFLDSYSQ